MTSTGTLSSEDMKTFNLSRCMPTPFTMVIDVFDTARNFTAWSTPNLGRSSLAKLDTVEYNGKTLPHAVVPHADAGERGFGFLG